MDKIEKQVRDILKKVRPYLNRDGGDVELVEIKDHTVYVRMLGACANCMAVDETVKNGIESLILESVPDIIEVVNVK